MPRANPRDSKNVREVKGMIQEMIEKLVAEAQKEASHKAPLPAAFVESGCNQDSCGNASGAGVST